MLNKLLKERATIISLILILVLLVLWVFQKPTSKEDDRGEMSLVIPKGQVILPIELSNARQLAPMIERMSVVDVYEKGQSSTLIKNLRLIKLEAGEGPLFGALVPENRASQLQNIFFNSGLRAAIRPANSDPTEFKVRTITKQSIQEISIDTEDKI